MPLGSSLVDWRYDEAKIQGRLWTPRLFKSSFLSAWYDLSQGPLPAASNIITQVNDLSGNNNHGTASNQNPGYVPAGKANYNSLPYMDDGATFPRLVITNSIVYSGGTGNSVAAAVSANNTIGSNGSICGGTVSSLQLKWNGSNVLQLVNRAAFLIISSSNTAVAGGFSLVGCDAKTNSSTVWLDGTSTSNGMDPAFTNPITNILSSDGEEWLTTAGLGEILIFTGILSALERSIVDGYLAWKWRTVSKLNTTHPFLTRPPLIGDSLRIRQPFLAVASTPAATIAASGSLMPMMGVG